MALDDEVLPAVLALRKGKTVVLDLSYVDLTQSQRTADFVSGGITALDGREYRLGEHVFLFTPANVFVNLS